MNRTLLAVLFLVVVGCRTPQLPSPADPPMPEPPMPAKSHLSDDEQAVINATNAERKKAKLTPLTPDPKLTEAARKHAANMANQDKLDHTLDGKDLADRAKAAGYAFRRLGENIAWNQPTPNTVVASWMDSKGHRANILNAQFTHIGVAVAKNKKDEPYWVQVFGTPREK